MHARFWLWIALAVACPSAFAADPSFAELLAKAEAQYAAGHRWSPPGDNMVETVAGMMDKISTATPQQLAELSALLEKGGPRPPDLTKSDQAAPAPPVASPPVVPPPAGLTKSEPAAPERPVAPPVVVPPPAGLTKSEPAAPAPRVAPPQVVPPPANLAASDPAAPAPPVVPPPGAPPKPSPQASARAADLLARGKQAEDLGNVSGARRFYASAAALGNGVAALALGRLYDPAYLQQTAMGGIQPDTELARYWYQRAAALGDPEAGRLLQALSGR